MWKRLVHPNIVVFKGVTFEPLQLVSEWVPGEVLREYIRENCHANLVGLVSSLHYPENQGLILFSVAWCCRRSRLSSFA